MGETGAFCKHCVAAGLVYAEGEALARIVAAAVDSASSPSGSMGEPAATLEDVRSHLLTQSKDELVELLLAQVRADSRLRERLLARAAKALRKPLDLKRYVEAIDQVTISESVVEYGEMWGYVRGIEEVVASIEDLLVQGYARETVALVEYFQEVVAEQMGMVDDSNGGLGGILHDLRDLHHNASVAAGPDPEQLAAKLLRWQLDEDYDVWAEAADQYADVLGESGLRVYRDLVEARWREVRPLGPDEKEPDEDSHRRHRLARLMRALAERTGDVDAVAAVLARDLSSSYRYLELAQIYEQAGRQKEALDWAERGARDFPERYDRRLREFLASSYHRLGRHAEAVELAWNAFLGSSSLDGYQALQSHAEQAGEWPSWRERALEHVRATIAQERAEASGGRWRAFPPDSSTLVSIFLWEGDAERAWEEARAGGCSTHLWLEVAALRKVGHPEDALPIYQAQVEPSVETKAYDGYVRAAEYLREVKELMGRLGRSDEFAAYLEGVRSRHRRKRNFTALTEGL